MTTLFGRYVRLVVETIEIRDLRITFAIDRDAKPEPNKASINVYNLSEKNRLTLGQLQTAAVLLEAGYEDGYQTLFLGNLRTSTTREEGPDLVTVIESGDGEVPFRTSRVALSLKKGATTDQALRDVAKALGVLEGNLNEAVTAIKSRFGGGGNVFPSGTVLTGSAAREMTNLTRSLGLTWSVQNGKLQIQERGKALASSAVLLSAATGMIGTPSIDQKGILTVTSLLNPEIFPGRLLVLDAERLKGNYLITECHDTGDTHGNDWHTEIKAERY